MIPIWTLNGIAMKSFPGERVVSSGSTAARQDIQNPFVGKDCGLTPGSREMQSRHVIQTDVSGVSLIDRLSNVYYVANKKHACFDRVRLRVLTCVPVPVAWQI